MALAEEGIMPEVARSAIRLLIREADELPTVASLLRTCRRVHAEQTVFDWRCPLCGSEKVAGIVGGPAVCFDCVWEGTL
jgi:hypothetical protein